MGNLRVKQANIYLYIPSLIAMLSIWPVASIEYFTYDSDFRDQVSLKEWLVGYDFYFYVHNFLNIVAPTILLIFCLVFIHKYLVSVILTAIYYVATLISLANYIFSDKFFDSSFSIFGKLKYYFGFY
jgi:predicted membrane protein